MCAATVHCSIVDHVLRAADGGNDGGGFGGTEERKGRFGEHLSHVVQTLVVDGLAHGRGGDYPPVGQRFPGEDPTFDPVGGQGFGEHLVVNACHDGAGLAADVARRDAQSFGNADKEGCVQTTFISSFRLRRTLFTSKNTKNTNFLKPCGFISVFDTHIRIFRVFRCSIYIVLNVQYISP